MKAISYKQVPGYCRVFYEHSGKFAYSPFTWVDLEEWVYVTWYPSQIDKMNTSNL